MQARLTVGVKARTAASKLPFSAAAFLSAPPSAALHGARRIATGSIEPSQWWAGASVQGSRASAAAGEGLTPDERMAACLVELRECSEATKRVTNLVQAQLDELGLRDDRKL